MTSVIPGADVHSNEIEPFTDSPKDYSANSDALVAAMAAERVQGSRASTSSSSVQVAARAFSTMNKNFTFSASQSFGFNQPPTPPKLNPAVLSGWELWNQYRVIDPQWKYKKRWDLAMILLLFFIAFVTPYEVAFLGHSFDPRKGSGLLFYMNRMFDLAFIFDVVLNFYTGFYNPATNKLEVKVKTITVRYLRGWFVVDVCSILPFFMLEFLTATAKKLRVLRLVRLLRLGKAWRMLMEDGLSAGGSIDYNTINLIMFVLLITLFSHWMACLWRYVPRMFGDEDESWVTGLDELDEPKDVDDLFDVYIISLYWSVMTVSTIGYGDIVPTTTEERIFDIVVMVLGGLVFGYIIGAVGNVVQQRNAKENEYFTAMTQLNDFMCEQKLPPSLQQDIRGYFRQKQVALDEASFMSYGSRLSPSLWGKLLLEVNKNWIERTDYFKGTPTEFTVEVAKRLQRQLFSPGEMVVKYGTPANEMYVIHRGIAAGNNRLFTVGHIMGGNALMRGLGSRLYSAHAITYVEASLLEKKKLMQVLGDFPVIKARFRILAIRSVFKEEVFSYTIALRAVRAGLAAQNGLASLQHVRTSGVSGSDGEENEIALDDLSGPCGSLSHKTRLKARRDLFRKTDRTQFYQKKLELITPVDRKMGKMYDRSARIIQTKWKKAGGSKDPRRRRRLTEREDTAQIASAADSDPQGINAQLQSLMDSQTKVLSWMEGTRDDVRSMRQEVFKMRREILKEAKDCSDPNLRDMRNSDVVIGSGTLKSVLYPCLAATEGEQAVTAQEGKI
ncbi:hypothetical protein CYMTET_49165 [Cymbomonas tetramitiformis]|uniref:Cyclic nucleotide-binding domain-containing protein n=1 Tax=Cymbomonas tetramitiformis TaxID=36881 RepID=A0AAE0EUF0_9CHLO|nr:hypothetical protein CYMTET_49165 [Cymbomonas tetramitiformis]